MKKRDFAWKPFLQKLGALAVPVALQNLLTTTGSMLDTVMIARLGETAVGAVGLCASFSSLMLSCYWGFVGCGIVFMSQYYGAGDEDGIDRSYGMMLVLLLCVGVLFGAFAVFFPSLCMGMYTDSEAVKEIGIQYLRIVGFAYPLQVIAVSMSTLLRSVEKVKLPLIAGIASVITNFCVNYILIFGKFGFPVMGVRGAAVGTVCSAFVNILVIVLGCLKAKAPYIFEFRKHFVWDRAFVKEFLIKCFPIFMNEIFMGISNLLISIIFGHQSEGVIAAFAVFRTIEGIVISAFSGFSNAATILVGAKVGAGDHETAYRRAWRLCYLCAGVILLVDLTLLLVHHPLLTAMGLSGEGYDVGRGFLYIYCIASLIRYQNWVQNDTFRTAGDSSFGSTMEIGFAVVMMQPVIHIANYLLHAPVLLVFALCYCDEPIRYFIMQRHMYSGKWIKPVSSLGQETVASWRKEHKECSTVFR